MRWNNIELPDNPYFQDKDVVIYCADCREILPLIPDKSIDLVLTDPPYGVGIAEWDNEIPLLSSWLPLCLSLSPTVLITPGNGNQWDYPRPDKELQLTFSKEVMPNAVKQTTCNRFVAII